MEKTKFPQQFLEHQRLRIAGRINKYKDLGRIQDELLSGDISPYTRYKQKTLVPILVKALAKIDNNEYGFCDACGAKIELERLRLVPAAEKCISCSRIWGQSFL